MSNRARVTDTSNIPQNDVGKYVRLHIVVVRKSAGCTKCYSRELSGLCSSPFYLRASMSDAFKGVSGGPRRARKNNELHQTAAQILEDKKAAAHRSPGPRSG